MKAPSHTVIAPGARILVRDAEWLVRRIDTTSTGRQAIKAVGISEIVRDKEATFLDDVEPSIEVLEPEKTRLVSDASPGYQDSLLYLESLLRRTTPTGEKLYVGHKAAMDRVPYQLDPAIVALQQPRQRILIADAVGLGKTLEAGILLSELIRRGRGKRILVACVKSMLTQFQKEMWSRFTIPLVRLDSIGIQRIRSQIPTNHNPFHYYDKSIISIDTLKQDREYRTYLENAYWDIIVIDEAHNVAERGGTSSLRSRLAKLLARQSDTLIMLSATPHDGKARSFASLMNMLDPTAIADPDQYGPEDIKGLFIRRFKKDIQGQVERAFKERQIRVARCSASPQEETAFEIFATLRFTRIDRRRGASMLFQTGLEKSLFSSPAACLKTIRNRLIRLKKLEDPEFAQDIAQLENFTHSVASITPESFSKFQKLVHVIRQEKHGFGWNGSDTTDRLVIFTERIETLRFLQEHLPALLKLKANQVEILHGSLSDIEQQRIVEDFGKEESPIRLLIASDVASEGINLHYLCHRMIHFDIPWSLMVFQQRNGRIDRYGQQQTPQIVYLVTDSRHAKIQGDTRILELLVQKDEEAVKNIGDPSALMGVYDIDQEELITATAIEKGESSEDFARELQERSRKAFDPLALLLENAQPRKRNNPECRMAQMPSLFKNDFDFVKTALHQLRKKNDLTVEVYDQNSRVELSVPPDLGFRFRFLPREIQPDNGMIRLSSDPEVIQEEIKRSRKDENAWPTVHYLWELNPVLEWLNDKVVASFARHEAPVITLKDTLEPGQVVFLIAGLIPNRKGHPLIHRWLGVSFKHGAFQDFEEFEPLLQRLNLGGRPLPNPENQSETSQLASLLPEAVKAARLWISDARHEFEKKINEKLNQTLTSLEQLRNRRHQNLERRFQDLNQPESIIESRKVSEKRRIDRLFDDYIRWVEETMTTEDNPYIQIAAVVRRAD